MTVFPSHSFEQYYQGIRRCWRYGQTRPVTVDVVTTDGERRVLQNLQAKAAAADKLFGRLVERMNDPDHLKGAGQSAPAIELPSWL
jgi:hypothetical protein